MQKGSNPLNKIQNQQEKISNSTTPDSVSPIKSNKNSIAIFLIIGALLLFSIIGLIYYLFNSFL